MRCAAFCVAVNDVAWLVFEICGVFDRKNSGPGWWAGLRINREDQFVDSAMFSSEKVDGAPVFHTC